jgi:hypothetical protein
MEVRSKKEPHEQLNNNHVEMYVFIDRIGKFPLHCPIKSIYYVTRNPSNDKQMEDCAIVWSPP